MSNGGVSLPGIAYGPIELIMGYVLGDLCHGVILVSEWGQWVAEWRVALVWQQLATLMGNVHKESCSQNVFAGCRTDGLHHLPTYL